MPNRKQRDHLGGRDVREVPAYTIQQVSHNARIPENTVRAWCFGRRFVGRDGVLHTTDALVIPADPAAGLLSFFNLLEVHVLRGLRHDHDLGMKRVRTTLDTLRRLFPNAPHPLIDRRMQTDGLRVFTQDRGDLIDLTARGQLAFADVFQAHLRRIDYDARDLAFRFYPFVRRPAPGEASVDPPRNVVIDPRVAFGRPVLAGTRIPTLEIAERWVAGDTIAMIAADYDQPTQAIEEALRWERAA